MSFFKTSKDKKDVEQGGTGYITASGCYPVNIVAPFVSVSKNNSTTIDLFIDHEDQKQVLYGNLRITNNNGDTNKIGYKIFNQLAVIAGVDDISDPVDAELPIGKNGADTDVAVLEDLADLDVILRVQMEYSVWNGSINEKKVIKGFYRAGDNASAKEIVSGTEPGVQYTKDTKYFDHVTYDDNLSEEEVAKWISDGRPKGTAGKSNSAATSKPKFGNKSKFGSKS